MTVSVEEPVVAEAQAPTTPVTPSVPDAAPPPVAAGQAVPDPLAVARAERIVADARSASELEFASFEELDAKPRRVSTFRVTVPGPDGTPVQRKMRYRALNGEEYDELIAAHAPTPKQRAAGAVWNTDTFPPALIAAVSNQPKLTVEQVTKLWKHPNWAPGEQRTLFNEAVDVCSNGLAVPFSESD